MIESDEQSLYDTLIRLREFQLTWDGFHQAVKRLDIQNTILKRHTAKNQLTTDSMHIPR